MKKLVLLIIASSLVAADFISISLGFMELSLFRISLMLLAILTIFNYIKLNKKFALNNLSIQSKIIRFYLLWLFYAILSLGWVKDYDYWIRAVFYITVGFLCIWTFSVYLKEKKDFSKVFLVFFIMLVIHNLIGLNEVLTGVYRFADMTRIDRYGQFGYNVLARTPVSMFGNTNDFATIITLGIFITYIIFVNTNSKILKSISILNIISSIYLLVRTGSRANMLGLPIGILVLIYLSYYRKITVKSILLMFAVPLLIFNPFVLDKILAFASVNLNFNFAGTGSDGVRVGLIKNGLLFLKETIGFGVGAGNIEFWMDNYKAYYTGTIRNMHNWWMEILVGYGVFIFIGYIWTYFKMFKIFYKAYIKSDDKFIRTTSLGLISLMSAFVVSAISSSSNIGSSWMWMLWGVVIAFVGYVENKRKQISY